MLELDHTTDEGCGEEQGHDPPPPAFPRDALERAAAIFRALADPNRLWLLERLSHGCRCVGDLAEESEHSVSTISQRLRVLRSENLVVRRRRGKHIDYELADGHVAELLRGALAHAMHD